MHWAAVPSNNVKKVQGQAKLIFLPQFKTNASLVESVICFVPGKLWNFREARMLYDKCIEK